LCCAEIRKSAKKVRGAFDTFASSRWLLRMRDLAGDDLDLTQEFLSQMIGARRSTVSLIAGTLQAANLIKYRRGHVKIVNVEGLHEASCECYEAVKSYYELLRERR
jgi:hypothetical protein